MTYEEFVNDVFIEHHLTGMSLDEIEELIEDSTFEQRLKWLSKNGYDVSMENYHLQMD